METMIKPDPEICKRLYKHINDENKDMDTYSVFAEDMNRISESHGEYSDEPNEIAEKMYFTASNILRQIGYEEKIHALIIGDIYVWLGCDRYDSDITNFKDYINSRRVFNLLMK